MCFSMNSLMSRRVSDCSSSKRNSASAFASSVLPTPLGPRNRNDPMGLPGSRRPTRPRRTARDTARTASSCPTTRSASRSSILRSLSLSASSILLTGMPVQSPSTPATSSSVTTFEMSLTPSRATAASAASSRRRTSGSCTCSSSPRRAKFCFSRACFDLAFEPVALGAQRGEGGRGAPARVELRAHLAHRGLEAVRSPSRSARAS